MFISHPTLATPHGFFGRKGGVSTGVYDSLNCRKMLADVAECEENRRRVCAALGANIDQLRVLSQMHTNTVITLRDPTPLPDSLVGDALVTNLPGLLLGIVTADCAPVLLHDPVNHVIGAAHSGWRGAAGQIASRTIAAMSALGAQPQHISAVIGPCIAQESYEVGEDVRQASGARAKEFFAPSARSGHFMFDLPGLIAQQLREAGINQVSWTSHNTYRLETDYFSCRRAAHKAEADFGLQLSAIKLTN
jgi:polyphenol oxidase